MSENSISYLKTLTPAARLLLLATVVCVIAALCGLVAFGLGTAADAMGWTPTLHPNTGVALAMPGAMFGLCLGMAVIRELGSSPRV